MPYIGQRPATGEANSFKILDEISSYTLTFNGSSADVVSLANDTITEREHRFVTGQRVTYNDGGGTAITGLSDGVYYIIVEDRHTIKLASSANNAASGTSINLTGLGVGASHTLNVAFDGVNTKFKATINNGDRAGITASGQLMLSINGVLQEPHDNTDSPTTGYATDHTSTIIFSAAPAADDQFFGRLIASNFATFDISDNAVDNFTGDGSTTDFTLSKSPANNESILVTIDGVVQYPDDNAATRAYSVSENILSFVSAPGSAVEIQVRHIGFAGAQSAGITGFYGRTGNAVLKSTDDIVFNNATASGTVEAANVTVTGDLIVNGTTTTLDTDLIGVDKLEVSANNTTVAAAITQTGSGDAAIFMGGNVGIGTDILTEKLVVAGDARITGILTVGSSSLTLDGTNNIVNVGTALTLGHTTGLQFHTQNLHSQGFEINNINATGIVTAGVANVNGSVRLDGRNGSNRGLKLDLAGSSDYIIQESTTDDIVKFGGTGSSNFFAHNISSGKVGIGTDNPEDKLSIYAAPNSLVFGAKDTTRGNRIFQILADDGPGNGEIRLYKNTASGTHEKTVEIASSGNTYFNGGSVGIGTANPARRVEIFDTAATVLQLNSTNSGGTSLRIQNSGTDKMYMGLAGDFIIGQGSNVTDSAIRANGSLLFAAGGGTERLRIDSSGNMGLGTASPRSITNFGSFAINGTAGSFTDYFLNGTRTGTTAVDSNGFTSEAVGSSTPFRVITNGTERLRITSAGIVGINKTSPSSEAQLDVVGSSYWPILVKTTSTGGGGVAIKNKDDVTSLYTGSGGSAWLTGSAITDGLIRAQNNLIFASSGNNERLRITSDGNVSIGGKSYPAWNSTVDALTIGYAGSLYEDSYSSGTNNYVILGNNIFYSGPGGGNKYIRNDEASRIMMEGGTWWFQNAAAGTAGNAITFVDRFKISNNGQIGMGKAGAVTVNGNSPLTIQESDSNSETICLRATNSGGNGSQPGIVMKTAAGGHIGGIYCDVNSDYMRLSTSGTDRMYITNTGNIGIGDNDPSDALTVYKSNTGNATGITIRNTESSSTYSHARLRLEPQNAAAYAEIFADVANSALRLGYNTTGSTVNIKSNGDVGIGVGSPEAKLHVEENLSHSSTYYLNSDAHILVDNPGSGKAVLKLEGEAALVYGGGSDNLIFADRQHERMRIDDSGNLRVSGSIQSLAGDTSISNLLSGRARIQRLQRGSNSTVKFSGQNGYIGDMLSHAGPTMGAVFYMGGMTSSSSSTASSNMLNYYYSGHWGQYTCIRIWMLNHYYTHGYKVWEIRHGSSPDVIIDKGTTGSVTTTNTLVGSGTHGGQNVNRINITCTNPGTYFDTRWYAGIYFGALNGIFSNNKTVSQMDAHLDSLGSGVHFLTLNDAALSSAPMYSTF